MTFTLVALTFFPFRLNNFGFIVTPLGEDLKWLRDHLEANDALMLDTSSNLTCSFPEEWDYYTRLYFPQGLRFVDHPEGTRRLWYVASRDPASQQVEKDLAKDYVPGRSSALPAASSASTKPRRIAWVSSTPMGCAFTVRKLWTAIDP